MSTKVEEARLRRKADRQGLILRKSRSRDPEALDYGRFALCDMRAGGTIHPEGVTSIFALTFDEVEDYLNDVQ